MSPYPTTRPLLIKINDVDRTASIAPETIIIQDILADMTNQASFKAKNGSGMSLTGLQTVVISSLNELTRYFGGVITRLTDQERGPFLDYDVDCEDFGWYLDHPEALIDAEYTGDSDQTIIKAFIATSCPDIEHDTYVEAVEASIDYIRFENETPRKALERLAALAGAEFYVDYGDVGHPKGHLHYFNAGTNAASFSLSDVVADPPANPYPYDDLKRIDTVPSVNRVTVIGRNSSQVRMYATTQDSEVGGLAYLTAGADKTFGDNAQDFAAWMLQGATAAYLIIVVNTDGTEAWGYLGEPEDVNDTEQGALSYTTEAGNDTFTDNGQDFNAWASSYRIYVVNSNGTLSWAYLGATTVSNTEVYVWTDLARTVRGWNGADPTGLTPSSYNVMDDNNEIEIRVYKELTLVTSGWNGDSTVGKTPLSYKIFKSQGDYGYWIDYKLIDNDLITTTQLRNRGDQYLADVAAGVGYTCTIEEPGLQSGQDVTLVNALRSINASFMIRRVTTRFTTGGYAEYDLELGARKRRIGDVLVSNRNIWDEEKFLPKRPGKIEQESAGEDTQTLHDLTTYNDQLDYPPLITLGKSHSDTLTDLVPTVDGEVLASLEGYGVESGGDWYEAGYFDLVQDAAAEVENVPAHWEVYPSLELQGDLSVRSGQELRLYDNGNYVGLRAPALAADQIWVLPAADGAVGEYLKTDGAGNLDWDAPPGGGDVVGPVSSTDNAIVRWDGASGALLQDSGVLIDDIGNLAILSSHELRFYDDGNYVGFEAPALAADQIWVLPAADGVANSYLKTSGAGVLSWDTPAGGDVVGPASSTNNAMARWDGTGGNALKDTSWVIAEEIFGTYHFDVICDDIDLATTGATTLDAEDEIYILAYSQLYIRSENSYMTLTAAGDITLDPGPSPTNEVWVLGDLDVTGTLTKGGGSFKIDHPLRPDTHWLYHSMMESPEMLNLYDGLAKLDEDGRACIDLPAYFGALNRDFRYQLTPIGAAMTMLHIASEVEANRFLIAGGKPDGLVSWQVTGIRQDAWANEHRIIAEVEKGEGERGMTNAEIAQRRREQDNERREQRGKARNGRKHQTAH